MAVDWEAVEREYRAGVKTLRQMAEEFSVSNGRIAQVAKRDGWPRDIVAKVKTPVILKELDELDSSGFVYVIYLDDTADTRFYKIGMASHFNSRFSSHQCSSPFDICVACVYFVENMRTEERILHSLFDGKKIRGEWYALEDADLTTIALRSRLV